MISSFDSLNTSVQKIVWEMGWQTFRPVQEKAIDIIINSDKHLIISAPTASGKTEAAFLPLISRHFEDLSRSLGILYISPLKALINDQFSRLKILCDKTDILVTPWHGDTGSSQKKKLLKNPQGILLITPESIEALLIHKEQTARRLFNGLFCVVIDEIHYFLNGERGIHLFSLLNRIELTTGKKELRKIALSATTGDGNSVKKWMSPAGANVKEIIGDDSEKEVFGTIVCYEKNSESATSFNDKLSRLAGSGKTLIFSNSKNNLESSCDKVKQHSLKEKLPDNYRIHHGSLSKDLRASTERELKNEKKLCVFCTTTLELGIDIGDVEKVIMLSPPGRVSSFIQRIGRSGRKEGKSIQFAFLLENPPIPTGTDYYNSLQIEIVKSIALIELYLEGYCESYPFDLENYSCLVHQLLGYIRQVGGCSAQNLYRNIVQKSFQECLTINDFIKLLRHLREKGYLEQLENRSIALAEKGEILTGNFKFFSVFQTPLLWKVINKGALIGEVPFIRYYKTGDHILLAGKRWEIKAIEKEYKHLIVSHSRMKKEIIFNSFPGITSKEIHQKMKKIYEKKYIPPYVNIEVETLLGAAFKYYTELSQNTCCLFHFQGSRIGNTLEILLKSAGIKYDDFEIGFDLKDVTVRKLLTRIKMFDISNNFFLEVISSYCRQDKELEKYDYLLPDFLLDRGYIKSQLDIPGAEIFIHHLKGYYNFPHKLLIKRKKNG